ncbi:MAG: hypothetical protein NVS3B27_03260 [Novosphingobium sp.]
MSFDELVIVNAVDAAVWPGETEVVDAAGVIVMLTLRSTVTEFDAVCAVWFTPPTW